MIDLVRFRADPAAFGAAWARRGLTVDVDELAALDAAVRQLKHASETRRASANDAAREIGRIARDGGDISEAREQARRLGDEAKRLDEERAARERELHERLLELPNPDLRGVPDGAGAEDNEVVAAWGEPPELPCEPRPHWEIAERLGILDLEGGARLAGSGFAVYRGAGARLNRALVSWFLDRLTAAGHCELGVPFLVRPEVMRSTGQLPKFEDQLYRCERDELYLIPTAEVPVTSYPADRILDADELPLRYCAYTPCFRREAGAAGIGTRGVTRVHQFDKVEMVWLTLPERGDEDLLALRGHAEAMLQELGLHHRVVDLCAGDIGFSAARTFDLEVWSPGTGQWLEVSSCSSFGDFQARRAALRYRTRAGAKPRLVHTLNGSALALPRCVIALLESGLRGDGSVALPAALHPYMGCEAIAPA